MLQALSKKLSAALTLFLQTPLSLGLFLTSFLAILVVRLTVENVLFFYPKIDIVFIFFEFTHLGMLSLLTFFLFIPLVRYAFGLDFTSAAKCTLFGFIIMPIPPIIDRILLKPPYFSFYEFDGLVGLAKRFVTFFGDTPEMGITYGPRIISALTILFLTILTIILTKKVLRGLLVGLWSYGILFFMGTFPAWITILLLGFQKGWLEVSRTDVVGLFLSPQNIFSQPIVNYNNALNIKMSLVLGLIIISVCIFVLWSNFRTYFFALMRNARLPQVVYHAGLFFLGIALAFLFTDSATFGFFEILSVLLLIVAVECSWLASVIVNDYYDTKIDALTNPLRPLIQKTIPLETYRSLGAVIFFFSLLFSGIVNFSAMFLLLAYQALAWIYSAPPLRLKRFPIIATLLAGAAGILVLISGYIIVSPEQSIHTLPLPLLFYLFFAFALTLPIKDFKDIAGDKKDHVYTLPVILGAQKAKLLFGSLTFLLYIFSPFALNARGLFLFAVIFGSLAFWTIQKGEENNTSFFSYRKLPGILLAITALYGLVIVFTLF